MEKESNEALPDKETIVAEVAGNKKEESIPQGEYSEEKNKVMGAMKSYYGEDVEINDDNYSSKMEEMITKHYMPGMETLGKYNESNTKLLAMMEDEPELAGMLSDMSRGAKAEEVIPRYFDLESIKEKGTQDVTAWEENNRLREERYNKGKERKKVLEENQSLSAENFGSFAKERGMDEGKAEEFGKFIADTLDDAYSGKFTPEFLSRMFKAMTHELEVANAAEAGEIKGKNEKIVEKKLSDKDLGDKMPVLNAGRSEAAKQEEKGSRFVKNLNKTLERGTSIYDKKG